MAASPSPAPLRPAPPRKPAGDSLGSIRFVLLTAAIISALFFGREVLIPLALALLISFLLAPLVGKLERFLHRIPAVLIALGLILTFAVSSAWVITHQAVDLAERFPGYKENIRSKLRSIKIPEDGVFTKLSAALEDLKQDVPSVLKSEPEAKKSDAHSEAIAVRVVENPSQNPFELARTWFAPVLGPLGTSALVFLLVAFMLLKWDDLRNRTVRLIGQGRISLTTRAMDDAGQRIRRYLLMQLVVNVTYGIPLAIGLYFIGVPNAILWGALATVLRFIPYIGPWIAATFPILISLAVSPSWLPPILTISLFVVIELISNNVLEPWLYGSSTGVSSIALIVAAVFWTWMWGPVGLVLATPITVCLVVMGQHIPRLSFLNIALGEDEALTPAEDCYHRLLRAGHHDEAEFVDAYLKNNSVLDLYDNVLAPVLIAAESDFRDGLLEAGEHTKFTIALRDLIEDLPEKPLVDSSETNCRIEILSARADRDGTTGLMLAQMLRHHSLNARATIGKRAPGQLIAGFEKHLVDLVILAAVSPSTAFHARNLTEKIRRLMPDQKIAVFLLGSENDPQEDAEILKAAGIDLVFRSFGDALAQCQAFASEITRPLPVEPSPGQEAERLRALERLRITGDFPTAALQRLTKKAAHVFDVPMVSLNLIDSDRQLFKVSQGLPEDLTEIPRDTSICHHVITGGETLLIEDASRDRRFKDNPLVRRLGLRFYAGAPLTTTGGHTIGSLCLMDTNLRRLGRSEQRLLEDNAAEIIETIERIAREQTISVDAINSLSKE
ncbi:MAG: AI-2E family transporter [Luteolibacter sp.]